MTPEHIASPHCWCDPELVDIGVYVHHEFEGAVGDAVGAVGSAQESPFVVAEDENSC